MSKTLAQKIHAIYQELKTIAKDDVVKLNATSSYEAVSHDAVTDLVHAAFEKHGIIAIPYMDSFDVQLQNTFKEYNGNRTESQTYMASVTVTVTLYNVDDRDDTYIMRTAAYALDRDDKATGKAFSMAVKNLYLKLLLLRSLDKEEQRELEREERQQAPKPPPKNHAQPIIDAAKSSLTPKQVVDAIQTMPDKPEGSFGEYIIQVGTKHKGKRLKDVPKAEVAGFIQWMETKAREEGKPIGGKAKELKEMFMNLYPEG